MPRLHTLQSNFSSGTLDPTMRLRVDTGAYQGGMKTLRNVALLNTGGGRRRPGTRHVAALAGAARLRRFEFDADERYCFAFQAGQVQIFSDAGTLLTTLTGARWTGDHLRQMTFAQLGDVLMVFHPAFQPHVIRRTSLTAFQLENFAFATDADGYTVQQPFFKLAPDFVSVTVSASSGEAAVIAYKGGSVYPYFRAEHIGTRLRILDTDVQINSLNQNPPAYQANCTILGIVQGTFAPNPLRTTIGSAYLEVTLAEHGLTSGQSITISGANDIAGLPSSQINGTFAVTVLDKDRFQYGTSGAVATASIDGGGVNVKYNAVGTQLRNWKEAVYSNANGWPSCGAFHQQRLFLGGGFEIPAGLWGSKVGNPFSFDLGDASDTDAIGVQIGQENGVAIRHLISGKHLQIFAEAGEYYVPRPNATALTPLTFTAEKQTPYGVGAVAPSEFDGATIFIQRTGTVLREFIYSETEGYAANPLSIAAPHVLREPVDLAVVYGTEARPEQYAHIANADGSMAVFQSARVERLAGWAVWDTPGTFHSVTTVGNVLWACVLRDGTYYLERLAEDENTLDAASDFTSASAQKVWNVGTRYAGLAVEVVSRNAAGEIEYALGTFTVAGDGTLTLPSAHAWITVGLDYGLEMETLPPVIQTDQGTMLGETKRIVEAKIALDTTLGVEVDGQALVLRQVTDDLSQPPARFTGYQTFRFLGYAAEPTLRITQADPLPLTVLGLIAKVSV